MDVIAAKTRYSGIMACRRGIPPPLMPSRAAGSNERDDDSLIAEAGYRSGTLHTAARAAELGRPVGAIPGPITSATSTGCHRLLRDGLATVVTGYEDVRELLHGVRDRAHRAVRERAGLESDPLEAGPSAQGRDLRGPVL